VVVSGAGGTLQAASSVVRISAMRFLIASLL
jgi:hypothetical protein